MHVQKMYKLDKFDSLETLVSFLKVNYIFRINIGI